MSFETIDATVQVLWRYDYDSNIKPLRDLYEVAKKEQWNAATDIPWEIKTDPAAVGDMSAPNAEPFDFVKALSKENQIELAKRKSAHLLSTFLHGEQGAMMICGQLVEVVPDMDAKLYASTQVIDEARHVEVFHRYIQRLDRVYPIMHGLKALLNAVLQADLWQMKCVGMQVIAESIAMGGFKTMAKLTHDEVFRRVVELTAQDEAPAAVEETASLEATLSEAATADPTEQSGPPSTAATANSSNDCADISCARPSLTTPSGPSPTVASVSTSRPPGAAAPPMPT